MHISGQITNVAEVDFLPLLAFFHRERFLRHKFPWNPKLWYDCCYFIWMRDFILSLFTCVAALTELICSNVSCIFNTVTA